MATELPPELKAIQKHLKREVQIAFDRWLQNDPASDAQQKYFLAKKELSNWNAEQVKKGYEIWET